MNLNIICNHKLTVLFEDGERVVETADAITPVIFGQPAKHGEKKVVTPSSPHTGSKTLLVQPHPTLHSLYKLSVLRKKLEIINK